jgi:hypothetical protein
MKTLHAFLSASLIGISTLFAEDGRSLPDLSKAFPSEKLFNQTKLEGIETYAYATDFDFADLKKKFIEFLGKGWTEAKVDPEIEKSTNEAMKAQGMAMEGNTLFSNPEFPGTQIGLTQMKMELEGKKFMANITVIRNKAEQSGAGQPATGPVDEPEVGDKPQPEAKERSR